jgi:hypothetical protein
MSRITFIEHITGKTMQKIVLTKDEDGYEIDIAFTDKTAFHIELELEAQVAIDLVELRDWKTGDGKLIKKFV